MSSYSFLVFLISALPNLARGFSPDITYLGCYIDSSVRLLPSPQKDLSFNSPMACVIICRSEGYTYAGVESSNVCFCGNQKPDVRHMVGSKECNSHCSGIRESFCGGHWRLTLYHTGLDDCPRNISYVGCYKDSSSSRILSRHERNLFTGSPIRCANLCRLNGYSFAGVVNGNECFCDQEEPRERLKVGGSECDLPCSEDEDNFCGGNWRLQLYNTGLPTRPSGMLYLGCFKDNGDRILPSSIKVFDKTNTPTVCNDYCKELGFLYSGVEHSASCFCGNARPSAEHKVGEAECDSKCRGDDKLYCGGTWRIQVFQTGLPIVTPNTKYLGCYKDSGNRLLPHPEKDLKSTNTPQHCANLCRLEGFSYSGVENGNACFCGNSRPGSEHKTGESECNVRCKGDSRLFCGGYWRIQVFHTGIESIVGSPQRSSALGCYKDESSRGLFSFSIKLLDVSPGRCANHCKFEGYLYAGVRDGNECFCDDDMPEDDYKVGMVECNSRCSGDQETFCGGDERLLVYQTGLEDCSRSLRRLGCYKDSGNPKLFSTFKKNLKKTNSPIRCANLCRLKGYSYSGVENGYDCFCGESEPRKELMVGGSECNTRCPGDMETYCGGPDRLQLFYIGSENRTEEKGEEQTSTTVKPPMGVGSESTTESPCRATDTLHLGKPSCAGQIIFQETFDKNQIDHNKWSHSVFMPWAPDYEFVVFDKDSRNSFVKDGKLHIKPTLREEDSVTRGTLNLIGCTGPSDSENCRRKVTSYFILPPVQSARLHTKDTFNFRYGIVNIRAKLPVGEWIMPELWLVPARETYGSDYFSGRIRLAMSRGNRVLQDSEGVEYGIKRLESGVLMGDSGDVRTSFITKKNKAGWNSEFHNYTLIWKPDNFEFLIDGEKVGKLVEDQEALRTQLGIPLKTALRWKDGSDIAPFDQDFYLSVGVSVGGLQDVNFKDDMVTETGPKPWSNTEPKALLNFWKAREKWHSTWDSQDSALQIDSITVTALRKQELYFTCNT